MNLDKIHAGLDRIRSATESISRALDPEPPRVAVRRRRPPEPPPVRPEPPAPGGGLWPSRSSLTVGVEMTTRDGFDQQGAWTRAEWAYHDGWRSLEIRVEFVGTIFAVFVDQFRGFDASRVTWTMVNGFPGRGAALFSNLRIDIDGEGEIYSTPEGMHAVQVRGFLSDRVYIGPDAEKLENYEHIEPVSGYPDWVPAMNAKGLVEVRDSFHMKKVGLYEIGDPGVSGSSSLNGSHGGWEVGPYHMGPLGWQRASRKGYMWAEDEMMVTLNRCPLACFDRGTLKPLNQHTPYWPGRQNVVIPGFEPDPDPECPYLPELDRYEAHSYSHGHRMVCGAAMLAEKDSFARFLLTEVYWHDYTLWLDGAPSKDNKLLQPLAQVLEEHPANIGWSVGGRGFAHTIRCFLYAEPYLPTGDAWMWRKDLTKLVQHVIRENGIIHDKGEEFGVPHAARAREVDLMYPNLEELGLYGLATACRRTMSRTLAGHSAAASFDGTKAHWSDGAHTAPDDYPWYDLIRHDLTHLRTDIPLYSSPYEQQLSLVHPRHVL